MRVPRDTIPDRRDFFETSETRRSPKGILEADLVSQPIERTQNFCWNARKFRWFHRLKQIFGPPRAKPKLRHVQKCLLMKETKLSTFMNFTLSVKNGTHDVVSFFLVMNWCWAILCSELSWEFSHFYKFEDIFCTNSRRERAYCWDWVEKMSPRAPNWEGKIRVNGVLTR